MKRTAIVKITNPSLLPSAKVTFQVEFTITDGFFKLRDSITSPLSILEYYSIDTTQVGISLSESTGATLNSMAVILLGDYTGEQ